MSDNKETEIIKDQWQTLLQSENFDLCRICLLNPESDQNIRFYQIFGSDNDFEISEKLSEFLGLVIDEDDRKPKLLCQTCYETLREWVLLKKNSVESQTIIDFIKEVKFPDSPNKKPATSSSSALPETNQSSSNITDIPTYSKNTTETTNLNFSPTHSQSKSSTSNNSGIESNILHDFCSSSRTTPVSQLINKQTKSTVDDQTCESGITISSKRMNIATEAIRSPDYESADKSILENNFINEYINKVEIPKIIYCSICKDYKYNNHDCSQFNKEFSTCLIPNCNILFRSFKDFTPHYQKHTEIPTEAKICRRCFKENKKSERDENGCHIKCFRENIFKCYSCKVTLNNMPELAFHKLKEHSCQLLEFSGNYLCFYCEKSSPDLMEINEHMKNNDCLED